MSTSFATRPSLLALQSLLAAERRHSQQRQNELMHRCLAAEAELLHLRLQRDEHCADQCRLPPGQRNAQLCQRCTAVASSLQTQSEALATRLGYRSAPTLPLPRHEIACFLPEALQNPSVIEGPLR